MPWSEARLWSVIRKQATGARFRRQVPIGWWIADFASFDPRVVIEVDGDTHDNSDETTRTAWVEAQGFTILRFDNLDIRDNLDSVFDSIVMTVEQLRSRQSLPPQGGDSLAARRGRGGARPNLRP
jgi:very-short-patch-repair endonuclease